ncbi:MAG TPA: CHAT domain-containing tetratricopeptide repeat protein [Polyangiaceae bacterium]|nr:CHAT domain-containing tetratricopeptide repeat protein [Polyangiaceae bacterium]
MPKTSQDAQTYKLLFNRDIDVNALLAKIRSEDPLISQLLDLRTVPEQLLLLTQLSTKQQQALFVKLMTLSFSLEKAHRYREAIAISELRLELVRLQPQDEVESFLDRSVARNRGDVLATIAHQQDDSGELGMALAAHLEAEQCYSRDAAVLRRTGKSTPLKVDRVFHEEDFRAINFGAIADIYRRLNQPDQQAEFTRLAWEHSKRGEDDDASVERLIDLAGRYNDAKDLDRALGTYWKALDLAVALKSSQITGQTVVRVLGSIAAIYAELGLSRRALELYERCLAIDTQNGHLGRQQQDLTNIAEIHAALGDHASALVHYERALLLCCAPPSDADGEKLSCDVDGSRRHIIRLEPAARVLLAMARLLRATNITAAERHLRSAADVVEQVRRRVFSDDAQVGYQQTAVEVFDELIELTYGLYLDNPDQSVLEGLFTLVERAKSRVLMEMLADQPLTPAGVPSALLSEETRLLALESQLEAQLASSAATELVTQLDDVRRHLESLWNEIEQTPLGVRYVAIRRARPIDSTELRELLRGQERVAAVSYFVTEKRVLALIVRSDVEGIQLVTSPVGRSKLRAMALVDSERPPALDLRVPYWQLDFPAIVVDPVRSLLGNSEHVVLIPHDVLHSLPLHALATAGTPPLVAERSVSFAPSASVLRFCLSQEPIKETTALVLGAPVRPDEAPLPRAAAEVVAVASALGVVPQLGIAASRSLVLSAAGSARYIHIACHNHFNADDPLASSLRLTDGDLTARDIFGLKIAPELLVLSACQSGVSSRHAGDELIGLVRALFFAGAGSIIVSLWNAFDTQTTDLMVELYGKLRTDRQKKSVALAEAQRALKLRGARVPEWAAFILIGAWR